MQFPTEHEIKYIGFLFLMNEILISENIELLAYSRLNEL